MTFRRNRIPQFALIVVILGLILFTERMTWGQAGPSQFFSSNQQTMVSQESVSRDSDSEKSQESVSALPEPNGGQSSETQTSLPPIVCSSKAGEQQHCSADTSAGVVLARSTGGVACILGKTWGYDDAGVWVKDGCSGEFLVGQIIGEETAEQAPKPEYEPIETWGEFDPGEGFLVGRSSAGELSISAYALVRYVNQLPAEQTFTDHLGNERVVDTRNDIFPQRVMVFTKGWVGTPKLIYVIFFWTVNATDQNAIFGTLGYQFSKKFSLYGGINGLPGSRSVQGSHPYWLGHDRVMADEFFRPFFTFGVWGSGEIVPGLWYNAMVGNNLSSLGVTASQLDRKMSGGFSFWWMPTTQEFGPKGGYGDYEMHEKLATRFGISTTFSPEQRFTDAVTDDTKNTTIRLADSVNLFSRGALAPDVAVQEADYSLIAFDAGVKYKGIFLQTEYYTRRLDGFVADGPLPVDSIVDTGFYVQGSFFPIPKKLEVYAATSHVFGDKDAGFDNSSEYIVGMNFYPVNTRNHRFNLQVIDVNHSPVSSTFGYYVGGQDGPIVSTAFSVYF